MVFVSIPFALVALVGLNKWSFEASEFNFSLQSCRVTCRASGSYRLSACALLYSALRVLVGDALDAKEAVH